MATKTQNKKGMGARVPTLRFPEFSGPWEEKFFSKVFSVIPSKKYQIKNLDICSTGTYPVVDQGLEVISGYSNESEKVFENIPVIVFGDHTTIVKYIDFSFIVGADGTKILKNNIGILKYLYYCLIFNNVEQEGYKRHFSILKNLYLQLPENEEQQKIVGFLGVVDEKIEGLAKKKKSLEAYKKGVMQKIFSQEVRFKDENGNSYLDWEEKRLGDVLKIGSGRDHKHLNPGNIPVFGTGGYMFSVDKHLGSGETVFIGRKGTINKPFYHNGDFWTVDTLFYTYDFSGTTAKFTDVLFQQINWLKYNEASGVPSLSKTTIEKIKIKLPSLPEQKKIAEFLTSLDEKISTIGNELNCAKAFKKGLLQQMFV
jgi:type I restriction enzyme, S subunit